MRDYADSDNLHARIYAMRSRLLSMKDYMALAKNQDSSFLISLSAASDIDSVEVKATLFREQIAKLILIAEAAPQYTPLFIAFFRQFEAHNAKLIIAKAFNLSNPELWYDIRPYAILDRSLLNKKTTLEDIKQLITGTYLSEVLEDTSNYEQIEISIDLCAVKNLYKASVLFSPDDKLDFQNLMGRRIAVSSTILALRLKQTFQWDDEKVGSFLKKFHTNFEGKIQSQVKIVEEMLDRHLKQVQSSSGRGPDVMDIEHYLEQYFYTWISSRFHGDFHSISCVVAYLWLLFYQIKNLFRIIDGRRFSFTPDYILRRIVANA